MTSEAAEEFGISPPHPGRKRGRHGCRRRQVGVAHCARDLKWGGGMVHGTVGGARRGTTS